MQRINDDAPRRRGPRSAGLGMLGVVRRVVSTALGALTASPPPRHRPMPAPPPDAVLRAREALAQAAAEMPTLLHDEDNAPATAIAPIDASAAGHVPSEAAALRQALRAYTDQIDRLLAGADEERWALRAQVAQLTAEVSALRAELAGIRVALPPPPAPRANWLAAPPAAAAPIVQPPADSPDGVPEDVSGESGPSPTAGESGRRFPPGGEGVVLSVRPAQRPQHIDRLCRALEREPLVERVLPAASGAGVTRVRLRLREPGDLSTLRHTLERALGAALAEGAVQDAGGEVELRLQARSGRAAPSEPG